MSKKLTELIKKETKRQQETIDLIPSENVADPEMLEILGSPLVNKYSEGYPGRRYYPGNEFCDEIENLARKEGLKVFGLKEGEWFLNVQAYSGSPANMAIYFALTKPGDTVMGLRLADGGHLTHGHPVNFSGTFYKSVQFGVHQKTGLIDYEDVARLAKLNKPTMIVLGTTSYSRLLDFKKMRAIADSIGAKLVADVSHVAGLIAGGVYPSPFPYADVVMATTHKTMRGPRGAVIFTKGEELAKLVDKAIMPGLQGGPHNNQTAAIAWMFEAMQKASFKSYAKQIVKNAKAFETALAGYGFDLVSGGTDSHLLVVDMRNKGLDGMAAQQLLEQAGIVANRNSVPGDEKPFKPSGIRMGTPAVTSRGMKEKQMKLIAMFMHHLFDLKEPAASVKKEVMKLCKQFPLPYK
jgi:glycine hydroxymethyltransferase